MQVYETHGLSDQEMLDGGRAIHGHNLRNLLFNNTAEEGVVGPGVYYIGTDWSPESNHINKVYHWTMLTITEDDSTAYYFDGTGLPMSNSHFKMLEQKFLREESYHIVRNQWKYMNPEANTCGQWCLFNGAMNKMGQSQLHGFGVIPQKNVADIKILNHNDEIVSNWYENQNYPHIESDPIKKDPNSVFNGD
ncbi:MAG: hypothetical protein GY900_12505 [Actinomycetia bacterium]|nr:hypothetical protein [Actinomycetes bacterium]